MRNFAISFLSTYIRCMLAFVVVYVALIIGFYAWPVLLAAAIYIAFKRMYTKRVVRSATAHVVVRSAKPKLLLLTK